MVSDTLTRFGVSALRKFATARRKRLSKLHVAIGQEASRRPTIYFLTPDFREPAGGVRVIYRHVDILNAAGIDAAVLHQRRGFRCTWFQNQTRVKNVGETRVLSGDLLVVPEVCIDALESVPPGIGYVIFNQNSHLTWKTSTQSVARHYQPGKDLKGVITVSRHDQEALRYTFGHDNVQRVHISIDSQLFYPAEGRRENRIAYMPRRMAQDAHNVLQLMRERDILKGWEIVPLHNLSQSDVAAQLRTTKIYLAFTHQEGFGLPPAEAMACGNFVIGQHGFGGREFFRPDFSVSIEAGDIFGFARALENAVQAERTQSGWCQDKGALASSFILSEYSAKREREEVTMLYANLLKACR